MSKNVPAPHTTAVRPTPVPPPVRDIWSGEPKPTSGREQRSSIVNTSTFVGNLAGDPKLITSRSGSERAVFSIALDEFSKDDDAPPVYVDVTVFSGRKDSFARNVAESLTKGKRVVVVARAST